MNELGLYRYERLSGFYIDGLLVDAVEEERTYVRSEQRVNGKFLIFLNNSDLLSGGYRPEYIIPVLTKSGYKHSYYINKDSYMRMKPLSTFSKLKVL